MITDSMFFSSSLTLLSGPGQYSFRCVCLYLLCMLIVNVECPLPRKFITSGCCGDLWLKYIFLILACKDAISYKRGVRFCTLGIAKSHSFGPTYCGEWGSQKGKVCGCACWLLALQLHFKGTTTSPQWHFNGPKKKDIFFRYWCFSPHRSIESVSSVCGIFFMAFLAFTFTIGGLARYSTYDGHLGSILEYHSKV